PDPPGQGTYPIVTSSWVLLYRKYEDATKANAVRELFRWCLREGQKSAAQLGYIQLPENVTERAVAAVDTILPRKAHRSRKFPTQRTKSAGCSRRAGGSSADLGIADR